MQPHDVTFEDPSAAWEDPSEPGMGKQLLLSSHLCFALRLSHEAYVGEPSSVTAT